MQNENTRNTIIFIVLTIAILLLYQQFVMGPQQKLQHDRAVAMQKAQAEQAAKGGGPAVAAPVVAQTVGMAEALAASPRIRIDTPSLWGSMAVKGSRIDNLFLTAGPEHANADRKLYPRYAVTLDKNSPPVELLKPDGTKAAYFAEFGWLGVIGAQGSALLTPETPWTVATPGKLTPGHPVTLTYTSADGLSFRRTIAVDDRYMFTVSDVVTNNTGKPVRLRPYSAIQRNDLPDSEYWNAFQVHLGAVQVTDRKNLKIVNYKDWKKKGIADLGSTGGWMGITDKYWLTALVPDQKEAGTVHWAVTNQNGLDLYQANFNGAERNLAPGASTAETTRLFAGAKRAEVLQAYQKQFDIPRFNDAIDWGQILWWLTKPIFIVLQFFYHLVGNFGLAILMLTVSVKLLFYPLANQAFASMTKMKVLQPKLEDIKKRFADDQMKQQQEIMALYQREKVKPLAGCLPILVQIPVFFALLKVLYVTIDMRHAPFFGWIRDLSDRDPTTVWNLFGLIPWDPSHLAVIGPILDGPLHLGLVALLYGATMWLQQSMSPSTPDPTQQQIMRMMPLIFMFILARYPIGLMIYWTWSTTLTILQQYVMMHRHKVENPIDTFLARFKQTPASG